MKNHEGEASLYSEVYETMSKNFITAKDREYMIYARFLTDPRDVEGKEDRTNENLHGDADWKPKKIYRPLQDTQVRFSGDYKNLYSKFISMLRNCIVINPNLAPKYILDIIMKPGEEINSEYSVTLDSINRNSWKELSKWNTCRNLIENCKKEFPDLDKLLDMYGEPECSGISSNFLIKNGEYVDIIDKEDAGIVIPALINKFGKENVTYYELQD